LCHIPPDDPENFHTIRINEKALPAHLAHGDFAGACNDYCRALCNDNDACTVDDVLDCEAQGCPAFPRDPVDSSDGLACTIDSCDSLDGISNTPVECIPSDLCHVSLCTEPDGECLETEKACPTGESCDLDTGDCIVDAVDCPCFTLEELQDGGPVAQCGENFENLPDLAGAIYTNGNLACSGTDCISGGSVGCSYTVNNMFIDGITAEKDSACRSLILTNCANPNAPVAGLQQSAPQSEGTAFIDQ
jgi:hypothetical protein